MKGGDTSPLGYLQMGCCACLWASQYKKDTAILCKSNGGSSKCSGDCNTQDMRRDWTTGFVHPSEKPEETVLKCLIRGCTESRARLFSEIGTGQAAAAQIALE